MTSNTKLEFLNRYIAYFKRDDVPFFSWPDQKNTSHRVMQIRGPDYDEGVSAFKKDAQAYGILRKGYMEIVSNLHCLPDEVKISTLSNIETEALITYYVRGDRFSCGFLAAAIQRGILLSALIHLRNLMEQEEGCH
ncbi:DUF6508 domain-containing protein [Salisediminibacterium beveridgei]|uniref:Uncharacterized protein n=1 Tax=Salisediminibacterium beveridgei TaxID=632773 RepID=A0A1D7QXY4_9BACI|nr:DUF6508 domain-containing protein [Salisediminibacterium beveridgei]AOM83828.1 hypothetical protein BBEV_2488 [Salisediminibacterium beveridgei]